MNIRPRIIILILFSYLCAVNTVAQTNSFSGTKTPYREPKQAYTPPPAGFKPVFVNHVGRHGARFLTKAGSDVNVLQLLSLAQKDNGLTPVGIKLKEMTTRFLSIEKGNYENITQLGREEQAGIGKRMISQYKDAFKGRGLEVVTTYKVRTQQSAEAFLKGFGSYKGKKIFHITPDSLDDVLRFYDLSPAYQEYKKSPAVEVPVDSLNNDARTKKTAERVCARVFTPSFLNAFFKKDITIETGRKQVKMDPVSFTEYLYDLYCVQLSIPVEMHEKGYAASSIDFGIAFDQKDFEWLSFKNDAADFLEKGAGTDTLGIQVKVATPLLAEFVNSTEAIINNEKHADAILRFTHAEAISPFATLLGVPQASSPSSSIYQYNKHWQAASIIPLSANIQWIIYSNGKEYLVKMLLNEKETKLPLATSSWPYYKWNDVKQYYLGKLQALQTGPKQDMHRYLTELK